MTTPHIVKVAKMGDIVKEVAVSSEMTVGAVLNSAGYRDFKGTIYAKSGDEDSVTVQTTDIVNGFDSLVLTTDVKGGLY